MAWIETEEDGRSFIYEKRPEPFTDDELRFRKIDPVLAEILGIHLPAPGEKIEWPPTAHTANPEPELAAETLVPITSLKQLMVGDKVKIKDGPPRYVQAIVGDLAFLSAAWQRNRRASLEEGLGILTLDDLQDNGYQQVITAPRTLNRVEAREAIDDGMTVRKVGGDVWYRLSEGKMRIISGTEEASRWFAYIRVFDLPDGRYEIVS